MISLKIRLLKPDAVPCIFSKSVTDDQLQSIDNDYINDHGEFSIDENPRLSPQKEPKITLSEDPDKRDETNEFSIKVEDSFSNNPFQKLVPEVQLESMDNNDSIDDHREFSTENPDERDETPMLPFQKEEENDIYSNKTNEFYLKVEDSFSNNPWCVDDATAFLKFCCPECEYQIPDLYMFSEHAIGNHSKSVVLFGHEKGNNLQIKEENLDIIERFDNYEELETDILLSSPQFDQYGFPPSGQEENSKAQDIFKESLDTSGDKNDNDQKEAEMLKTDPSDNKFQNSDEKELKDEGNTEVQNLDKTNQLCAKCGQHFTSLIDLVNHFFKLHKKPGEDFDCPMCPKIISLKYPTSKASVMEHMRNTHLKETRKCPICKQIFKLSHYKKHRRQVHGIHLKRPDDKLTPAPNPDGQYECPACKKVLSTKRSKYF